jgi:hypothetical protein
MPMPDAMAVPASAKRHYVWCLAQLRSRLLRTSTGFVGTMPLLARRRTIVLKNAIDDASEGIELGAPNRATAPIARRRRIPKHLGNRLTVKTETPGRLANRHPLDAARAPNTAIHIH